MYTVSVTIAEMDRTGASMATPTDSRRSTSSPPSPIREALNFDFDILALAGYILN